MTKKFKLSLSSEDYREIAECDSIQECIEKAKEECKNNIRLNEDFDKLSHLFFVTEFKTNGDFFANACLEEIIFDQVEDLLLYKH